MILHCFRVPLPGFSNGEAFLDLMVDIRTWPLGQRLDDFEDPKSCPTKNGISRTNNWETTWKPFRTPDGFSQQELGYIAHKLDGLTWLRSVRAWVLSHETQPLAAARMLIHGLFLILESLAVQSHQPWGLRHSAAVMYLGQIQICRNQKRPR